MPLFEMTADQLIEVPSTTFAAEQILERADLQRLLRAKLDMIVDDVLVIAEEFGAFADARRRIDLLGVDRAGHVVVVELKRTTDGGHLELQALRYAAMVSVMTFDDLVEHYELYLAKVEPDAVEEARTRLAEFLEDVGGEEAVLSREVRVVLVAAGFDREITTTVLWLNDVYGLDVRCVRLTPYKVDQRQHRHQGLDTVRDHHTRRTHRASTQTASRPGPGHRPAPRRCGRRRSGDSHPAFPVPAGRRHPGR